MEENNSKFSLERWVSKTRNWVELAVVLGTLLLGIVLPIYQLKHELALLNQKVDILLGDHEKRITALEAEHKLLNKRIDRLDTLHEK